MSPRLSRPDRRPQATTRALLGALMATSVALPVARAQDDGFALEQFEPRPAGSGILNVPTSHVLEAGSFSVDLWMVYSQDPLTIDPVVEGDPRTGGAVVPDRLGLDLLVAYGVWRGLEVSLAVPLGTKPSEGDLAVGGRSPAEIAGATLGDVRLAVDASVLRMAGYDPAGFGVLVGAAVYAPTGDPDRFEGESGARVEPYLGVDYATKWGLRVAGNVAYHIRPEAKVFNIVIDDVFKWRLGVASPLGLPQLTGQLAVFGTVHLADQPDPANVTRNLTDSPYDAAEAVGAVTWRFDNGLDITGGLGRGLNDGLGTPSIRGLVRLGFALPADRDLDFARTSDLDGDGIEDDDDRCPVEPETVNGVRDADGCPEDPIVIENKVIAQPEMVNAPPANLDRDGDGYDDTDDRCPDEPEDKDGYEDGDGCPEGDDDGDGLVDAADQCPQVAETFNGFEDGDGCPDVANDLDGDGVSDETDHCPREPEVVNGVRDWDGCPEDPVVLEAEAQAVEQLVMVAPGSTDPDGDGITGPADHCADVAEDFDNFEDDDGCPEADNDLDGIPDATDLCKLVAETVNGVEDTDGCPDLANDLDGDGVDDNQDLCPREPETLNWVRDWDGCPEDPVVLAATSAAGRRVGVNVGGGAPSGGGADTDRDGIGDAFDACPSAAEDADGFEDGDGCPDADNDGDGVPDANDACPVVAEVMNHFNDDDGCPDEVPDETKGLAGAVDAIEFQSNSARLRKSSIATLERIADVMKENPRLLLEVAGHTDDRGRRWWNVWLSEQRAKSVVIWLRKAGVPSDRIAAKGFGPDKPRDSNDTPEGRSRNRRVELTFTERRESK